MRFNLNFKTLQGATGQVIPDTKCVITYQEGGPANVYDVPVGGTPIGSVIRSDNSGTVSVYLDTMRYYTVEVYDDDDNVIDRWERIDAFSHEDINSKISDDDSRLTDSREWIAETIEQPEAEAGESIIRRAWTSQRVRQAITSWWNTITISIGDIVGLNDALSNKLESSDLENYVTDNDLASGLSGKANTAHTHSVTDVTGLEDILSDKLEQEDLVDYVTDTELSTGLSGKANTVHSHSISDVTGLTDALNSKLEEEDISDFVTTGVLDEELSGKANTSHTHGIEDVTGLSTALSGKADSTHTHSIEDVSGLTTALSGKASTDIATTSTNGLMSKEDKVKLDAFDPGESGYQNVVVGPGMTGGGNGSIINIDLNFGTGENSVCAGNDVRLSDSREWSTVTISQVDAESGTDTARKAWTSQRVRQAIVAWWNSIGTTTGKNILNLPNPSAERYIRINADNTVSAISASDLLDALGVQETITGGASTIVTDNLTASRALVSNASGKVIVSSVTSSELSFLSGVSSSIQTQLNNKATSTQGAKADTALQPGANISTLTNDANYIPASQKGAAGGVPPLDLDLKIPAMYMPSIVIVDTFVRDSQVAMLALAEAEQGDVCVRTDISKSFILTDNDPSVLANWQELLSPTSGVISINGQTGVITFNGAVTSILFSNLTSGRLLVSDGSGKVAVSAVTATEAGYLSGVTSSVQTQINSKQATVTGAATTITSSNLTASRAIISDSSGKVSVSAVTSTELGFVSGVTANIQTQLNSKQNTLTPGTNITIVGGVISSSGTSYSPIPIEELNTGSATTNRVVTASVLNNWLSGKNYITGNQSITYTGDVTGSGTTSVSLTITNGSVSNSKLANMAVNTIKGRISAGTGAPENLSVAQVSAMLNLGTAAAGTVTTSVYDFNVGRLTKVGDYGILGVGPLLTSGSDYDNMVTSGVYFMQDDNANRPFNYPTILSTRGVRSFGSSNNRIVQEAEMYAFPYLSSKRTFNGTAWSPWYKDFNSSLTQLDPAAGGTAAAPTYTISGNTNTGIYFPNTNEVGISTNGIDRQTWGNTESRAGYVRFQGSPVGNFIKSNLGATENFNLTGNKPYVLFARKRESGNVLAAGFRGTVFVLRGGSGASVTKVSVYVDICVAYQTNIVSSPIIKDHTQNFDFSIVEVTYNSQIWYALDLGTPADVGITVEGIFYGNTPPFLVTTNVTPGFSDVGKVVVQNATMIQSRQDSLYFEAANTGSVIIRARNSPTALSIDSSAVTAGLPITFIGGSGGTNAATTRTNLGLGTAATANVTTSTSDATSGRVLTVGYGGLHVPTSLSDFSNLAVGQSRNVLFRTTNAPTGRPVSVAYFSGIAFGHDVGGWESVLAFGANDGETAGAAHIRNKVAGVWQPWRRVLDSNQLNQSFTDTTGGRVLTVGYHGLGAVDYNNDTLVTDLTNPPVSSGFYFVGSGATGNFTGTTCSLLVKTSIGLRCNYVLTDDNGRVFSNSRNSLGTLSTQWFETSFNDSFYLTPGPGGVQVTHNKLIGTLGSDPSTNTYVILQKFEDNSRIQGVLYAVKGSSNFSPNGTWFISGSTANVSGAALGRRSLSAIALSGGSNTGGSLVTLTFGGINYIALELSVAGSSSYRAFYFSGVVRDPADLFVASAAAVSNVTPYTGGASQSISILGSSLPASNISGLGTAATATLTTTNLSTTAGQVVKVGDYGIGIGLPVLDSPDYDTLVTPGNYLCTLGNNAPFSTSFLLHVITGNVSGINNRITQEAVTYGLTPSRYFRRGFNGTTWTAWDEYFHSGSVIPMVNGGTGSATAPGARTNLGLGTAATANLSASGDRWGVVPVTDSSGQTFVGSTLNFQGADASTDEFDWRLQIGTPTNPDLLFVRDDAALMFVMRNSGQLLASSGGTAAAPIYSMDNVGTAGMYAPSAGTVGFSTASTLRFTIGSSAITATLPHRAEAGVASSPTYSFTSSTNTGMYLPSSGQLALSAGGSQRAIFTNGYVELNPGSSGIIKHSFSTSFGSAVGGHINGYIGITADGGSNRSYILLARKYVSTNMPAEGFTGTIYYRRGDTSVSNLSLTVDVEIFVANNSNRVATPVVRTTTGSFADVGIVEVTYAGETYYALEHGLTARLQVFVSGIMQGYNQPFIVTHGSDGFSDSGKTSVVRANGFRNESVLQLHGGNGGVIIGAGSSTVVLFTTETGVVVSGTLTVSGSPVLTTSSANGAVSTILTSNLTANRALISDGSGKVAVSSVTSTELGYLSGVTSSIQTQLNGKAASATGMPTGGTAGQVLAKTSGTNYAVAWVNQTGGASLTVANTWTANQTFSTGILLNTGSAGTPSLRGSGDTNTGVWFPGADQVGISTGGTNRFTVSTTAVTSTLEVSAPSFNTTSSLKYKTNIKPFESALDKIMGIDVITYNRKLEGDEIDPKVRLGVSAESLAKVVPELVNFVNGEPDSVNYAQGFALCVKAIQELVQELKK